MSKLIHSNIVTCFNNRTIGTKIYDRASFEQFLLRKLETFKFPENGQGFVPFDEFLMSKSVSAGIARREMTDPSCYVIREHRGEMGMFAKREYAANAEHLNVIVYTPEAYFRDPQVEKDEWMRVRDNLSYKDFVLVAVLATVGPKPPVSSHRFVRNLAGGNLRYSAEQGYTLEQAIAEAKAVEEYEKNWITVADE